jgi:hypothetical protein
MLALMVRTAASQPSATTAGNSTSRYCPFAYLYDSPATEPRYGMFIIAVINEWEFDTEEGDKGE